MNNDERRFEELWEKYRERLVRVLMRFGRKEEDARDVVQDVLFATWRRLNSIAPEKEWWYLKTAVVNRAKRQYVQQTRPNQVSFEVVAEPETEDETVEARLIRQEQLGEVERTFGAVFEGLSAETQLVFILSERGLSSRDIGRHLGMKDTAVRSRLMRANQQLDQRFGMEKR